MYVVFILKFMEQTKKYRKIRCRSHLNITVCYTLAQFPSTVYAFKKFLSQPKKLRGYAEIFYFMYLGSCNKDIMVVCDWFYNCYVEPRPAQPMDA